MSPFVQTSGSGWISNKRHPFWGIDPAILNCTQPTLWCTLSCCNWITLLLSRKTTQKARSHLAVADLGPLHARNGAVPQGSRPVKKEVLSRSYGKLSSIRQYKHGVIFEARRVLNQSRLNQGHEAKQWTNKTQTHLVVTCNVAKQTCPIRRFCLDHSTGDTQIIFIFQPSFSWPFDHMSTSRANSSVDKWARWLSTSWPTKQSTDRRTAQYSKHI